MLGSQSKDSYKEVKQRTVKQEANFLKEKLQVVEDRSYSSIETVKSECASIDSKDGDNSYNDNSSKSRELFTKLRKTSQNDNLDKFNSANENPKPTAVNG